MLSQGLGLIFLVSLTTSQHVCDRSLPGKADSLLAPEVVLAQYRLRDQAGQADINRDGFISPTEFQTSLYLAADTNSDHQVTLAEFLDHYAPYNFPSAVKAELFRLLGDLGSLSNATDCRPQANIFSNVGTGGKGVLQSGEITQTSFAAGTTVSDYRQALEMWVLEAAQRVSDKYFSPFIVAERYSTDFDYVTFFRRVDTAPSNDVISPDELNALLRQMDPTGKVSRSRWADYLAETFGLDKIVANVIFDIKDVNDDLLLTEADISNLYKLADTNADERVTTQEAYRFVQKETNHVRRQLGLPIIPYVYDCQEPSWLATDDCQPKMDATVLTMDVDYNLDGNVTLEEVKLYTSYMDTNGDCAVDRAEFLRFQSRRYGLEQDTADLQFDIADVNGDGVYTADDYKHLFEDTMPWVCACEFRVAALNSARTAERLAQEKKRLSDWLRLRYVTLMNEAIEHARRPLPVQRDSRSTWTWKTMNGRPSGAAESECSRRRCSAAENWGLDPATSPDGPQFGHSSKQTSQQTGGQQTNAIQWQLFPDLVEDVRIPVQHSEDASDVDVKAELGKAVNLILRELWDLKQGQTAENWGLGPAAFLDGPRIGQPGVQTGGQTGGPQNDNRQGRFLAELVEDVKIQQGEDASGVEGKQDLTLVLRWLLREMWDLKQEQAAQQGQTGADSPTWTTTDQRDFNSRSQKSKLLGVLWVKEGQQQSVPSKTRGLQPEKLPSWKPAKSSSIENDEGDDDDVRVKEAWRAEAGKGSYLNRLLSSRNARPPSIGAATGATVEGQVDWAALGGGLKKTYGWN